MILALTVDMNVHPNLTRHPKFVAFKRALRAPDALEYLTRVWGHCQERKLGELWGRVDPDYVESIAGWLGERGKLFKALVATWCGRPGWVRVNKRGHMIVTSWNEHNQALINSWHNGRSGGRPKKSHGKPTDNPRVSGGLGHGKPTPNPTGLDWTGLDVSGCTGTHAPGFVAPSLEEVLSFSGQGGLPEACARKFFYEQKRRGWPRVASAEDWQAGLQSYAVSWQEVAAQHAPVKTGAPAAGPELEQLEAELAAEKNPERRKALREKISRARGAP